MNDRWSLDCLYQSFQDPAFLQDFAQLEACCSAYQAQAPQLSSMPPDAAVCQFLHDREQLALLFHKLGRYAMLRQQAQTQDLEARSWQERQSALRAQFAAADAVAQTAISALPEADFEALLSQHAALAPYRYFLTNLRRQAKHQRAPQEEALLATLDLSGASAWEQLHSTLTSKLTAPLNGQTLPLSALRNLAYSPDAATRRQAYSAELAAYPKIEDSLAFCMNSIKLQTLQECRLRGYDSPLGRSLCQAHLRPQTLQALLCALEEHLPIFWEYLRLKGQALGQQNGLAWYDLFAPMGSWNSHYTLQEAEAYLCRQLGSFDPEMAAMVKRAFSERWIDFLPRAGKVGGAFCEDLYTVRQSRILTNFGGEFSDLVTLAHELGHAFHNEMLFSHSILCQDLPMPLAETASTFNENLLIGMALQEAATPQQELALLEGQLADACQITCDIYSRFLFEQAVFSQRETKFLSAQDLCEMMLQAQRAAYGTGLNQEALHPYMWACKSHYYSASLAYYNFPYAFGGLLARGLYARYQQEGKPFVARYKDLLRATTVMDAEEAVAGLGIDLTQKEFWADAMRSYQPAVARLRTLLSDTAQ